MRAQPGNDIGRHLITVGLIQDFVASCGVQLDSHISDARIAVALAQKLSQRTATDERVGVARSDQDGSSLRMPASSAGSASRDAGANSETITSSGTSQPHQGSAT